MKKKNLLKKLNNLHHPMNYGGREVCSECKVPFPCRTIMLTKDK